MKRNRIVINLDSNQPRPPRASGSRGGIGKVLLIIAIILLVIIGGLGIGGFFWWRSYQNGAAYSLAVLADAAQRDDIATMDSILDSDKISADFSAQVRQHVPGSSVTSLLPVQLDSLRSSASAKLKNAVHEQVIKQTKDLTDIAAGKPFFIVAIAVPYFVNVKQRNETAQATVNIKDQQIQLTMQADGDHWRIVAIKDEKLAKMIGEAVRSNLP